MLRNKKNAPSKAQIYAALLANPKPSIVARELGIAWHRAYYIYRCLVVDAPRQGARLRLAKHLKKVTPGDDRGVPVPVALAVVRRRLELLEYTTGLQAAAIEGIAKNLCEGLPIAVVVELEGVTYRQVRPIASAIGWTAKWGVRGKRAK